MFFLQLIGSDTENNSFGDSAFSNDGYFKYLL
jgi:hypothetical protein